MPSKYTGPSIFSYRIAFIINILLILNTAIQAQTVAIPDSGLESAIRYDLNKPTGDITAADMESLTSLSASSKSITDLTGLEAAVNLTKLFISGNQISDISALSGLTSLTWLFIGGNPLSDISALSGLTSLTRLSLNHNQLSDISALSGLTSLAELNLSVNPLSEISALSGLTSLAELTRKFHKKRFADMLNC